MENSVTEQSAINPAAETNPGDKVKTDSFGKFSSGEELLKAYNSLEQEFTRRSQRLKELEGKLSQDLQGEEWERKLNRLHEKYPVSGTLGREIGEYLKANEHLISDEDCLEKALLNVLASRSYNEIYNGKAVSTAENSSESANIGNGETMEPVATEIGKSQTKTQKNMSELPKIPVIPALSPAGLSGKPRDLVQAGKLAVEHLKKLKGD